MSCIQIYSLGKTLHVGVEVHVIMAAGCLGKFIKKKMHVAQ